MFETECSLPFPSSNQSHVGLQIVEKQNDGTLSALEISHPQLAPGICFISVLPGRRRERGRGSPFLNSLCAFSAGLTTTWKGRAGKLRQNMFLGGLGGTAEGAGNHIIIEVQGWKVPQESSSPTFCSLLIPPLF